MHWTEHAEDYFYSHLLLLIRTAQLIDIKESPPPNLDAFYSTSHVMVKAGIYWIKKNGLFRMRYLVRTDEYLGTYLGTH